jgi:hypothetical protein
MKNNWQVEINQEGTLFIKTQDSLGELDNLFGLNQMETGICIYGHELRSLRMMLNKLFPSSSIKSIEAIENLIKEEFCVSRSITTLKSVLDNENIPYRSFSYAA